MRLVFGGDIPCHVCGGTGGKHRSVAIAEALSGALRERGQRVVVTHRDLGRE
ncbi:MAG: hypothetical protein HGA44_11580 [Cellulomonadaceae bacterium]|nr:hypothetical protein [Cellulomonadaceae bacterium]